MRGEEGGKQEEEEEEKEKERKTKTKTLLVSMFPVWDC